MSSIATGALVALLCLAFFLGGPSFSKPVSAEEHTKAHWDPNKVFGPHGYWKPYVEIDGFVWDRADSSVHARLWSPIIQHHDWLLHGTIGGGYFESGGRVGSAGLGFRRKFDDVIFGLYGFVDLNVTENGTEFWTLSPGVELLGLNFEARANGYVPVGSDLKPLSHSVNVGGGGGMTGNILYDTNFAGIDGELGLRLPIEPGDKDRYDFWLYGGASYFDHEISDERYAVNGRLEWRINEVIRDLPGSRLSFMALAGWDEDDKFDFGGGIRARIPLGREARCFDRNPRTIDCPSRLGLARRMGEGIVRQDGGNNAVTPVSELLVDPETNVLMRTVVTVQDPTGSLVLDTTPPTGLPVRPSGTSPQTAQNYNTLSNATTFTNEVLVVVNGGTSTSPISYSGQSYVTSNTTVLGTGTTIQLEGQTSGTVYDYFVAGARPEFNHTASDGVIDLVGSGIHVAGLGISGDQASAGVGNHGIDIQPNARNIAVEQNVLSNLGGSGVHSIGNTTDVRIFNNDAIFDVEGDGIGMGVDNADTQIFGNTIRDTGWNGISFGTGNTTVHVTDNDMRNTGRNGVFVAGLNTDVNLTGNEVHNATLSGIYLETDIIGVDIIGNTIENVGDAGIEFTDNSRDILIDGNLIDGTAAEGIRVDAGSTNTTIQNNDLFDTGDAGILLNSGHTNVMISNNYLNGIDLSGISLAGRNENISITFNLIEDAGRTDPNQSLVGIRLADENGTMSTINNIVSDNRIDGVRSAGSFGLDVGILFQNENQNFTMERNVVLGMNDIGFSFGEENSNFDIAMNEIDGRDHGSGIASATVLTRDGIRLDGSMNQDFTIGNLSGTAISNRISNLVDNGIVSWNGNGSSQNLNLTIQQNQITNAGGAAVYFRRNTDSSRILDNVISNSGTGVRIGGRNQAISGPGLGNDLNVVSGNTITDSTSAGIAVEYFNTGGTSIINNTINTVVNSAGNRGDGIRILEGNQNVDLSGNSFIGTFGEDLLQIGRNAASNNDVSSTSNNDDSGANAANFCNVAGNAGGTTVFTLGGNCP